MRRHAILITNSYFPESDGALGKLQTVPQDLDNVKLILRNLRGKFELTPLPEMEAAEILGTIDRVLSFVDETDLVLIYYAGHGRILSSNPQSDSLLLATLSSKSEPNPNDDLPFKQIESRLVSRRIRRALIVLDCCYSGAVQSEIEIRGGAGSTYIPEPLPFDMKQYQSFGVSQQLTSPDDTDSSSDAAEASSDPNGSESPAETGIYIMTACTATQVAMGNRVHGSGDFTRHFIASLKHTRDESTGPDTLKNVFTRIREGMDQSTQTPMLICCNGTGDLTIARREQYGEGKIRTLLNWVPLPKEVNDSSLSMSPVYILDSGLRFVHWNVIFEDLIAKQIGLVVGAHALEFVECLDNKSAVLERNPNVFPVPNAMQLAQAEESGLIWSGYPLTDVEQLEFRSDRFKLIVFDKQAYQLPSTNFGGRRYWHVQLNVQYVQRRDPFWHNARKLLETQDMWNEYANSYDDVISPFSTYTKLVDEMCRTLAGKTQCLDIGSGTGNMLLAMLKSRECYVTAIEINDTMLMKLAGKLKKFNLSKRVRLLRGDALTVLDRMAHEWGDRAEQYDCCTMMNVLYALDDPIEYLKAIYRVLKPNGLLVLSTPHASTGDALPGLFDKLKTALQNDGKWPDFEKPWNSARRINEKLCENKLFTADYIRQLLREAKFEIDTTEMQLHFENCIFLTVARKPDTRILQRPTSPPTDKAAKIGHNNKIGTKSTINIFVSYSREDLSIANEFLARLKLTFKPARGFQFKFFKDDENILVGQHWREEIQTALRECDVGLLLLSPGFLGSEFINISELPQFRDSQKVIVPVLLEDVSEKHDLRDLDSLQIFKLDADRNGYAYTTCDANQRKQFVLKLFDGMIARLEAAMARSG